jgi:serine protease inhibitor ecotin
VARGFQVTGASGLIPTGATAVTGNLTVTQQGGYGYLYLGPVAIDYPSSSTLNFPLADDRANSATVALSDDGKLSITYVSLGNHPTAHVIFDVTGYFTPDTTGATFFPVTPFRVLDSRNGTGVTAGKFTANAPRTFAVRGGAVPNTAIAVTGNLTVTGQSSMGYLYIGPDAVSLPTSSSLNFPIGDNRANGVTVQLATDGTLSVTYVGLSGTQTTDVVFDVTGYFSPGTDGASYVAVNPGRVLDTRTTTGGLFGKFTTPTPRTFQVRGAAGVPTSAVGITGNLTVTEQNCGGYLYLGPDATSTPGSSTLNFPVGDNRANGVSVAVASDGTLSITYITPYNGTTAHAILDVTGYFVPTVVGP